MDDTTIDTLRRGVGTILHVEEGDIDVELTEFSELRPNAYSVLFEGPAEPVLRQSTYTFRTDGDATLKIFIVPLGPGASGAMVYEAVFTATPPTKAD
jgi:hypothetical protein